MTPWQARVAALITTTATTFALFWLLVHLLRPERPSREYVAIIVWTVPLAVLIAALAPELRRRLAGRWPGLRPIGVAAVAVASAFAWTIVAVVLTGGYVLAFDANPLWCWTLGALAGLAVPVYWPGGCIETEPSSPTA